MTRLIIVRHGHTALNDGDRFRGQTVTPLSEQGLREAKLTARAIAARWELSAVYTSAVRRAHETGEAIAEPFGLHAIDEPGILDMDYGEWTGLSFEEARARDPEIYRVCFERASAFRPPNGESFEELRERSVAAVKTIAERHGGQSVAVVTHTVIIRLILLGFMNMSTDEFWRIRQGTCAINVIEREGDIYYLGEMNNTCHMRKEAK
jgi:probable phosphoglycerate mutase